MATTGIVNILHTFARTKHGTCTPASSFWIISRVSVLFFFFSFKSGKLILMLHVNSTPVYNVCPGEESGGFFTAALEELWQRFFTGAAQAQGMLQGLTIQLLPK